VVSATVTATTVVGHLMLTPEMDPLQLMSTPEVVPLRLMLMPEMDPLRLMKTTALVGLADPQH
jgi:hypothetical protein